MLKEINYKNLFFFLLIVLFGEFLLLKNSPFFWDGISKSIRAQWIYDNNFSSIIVPTNINSGHPPLWISLLALFWEITGKTLSSARFLLFLVNVGVVYQLIELCKKGFDIKVPKWCFILVCLEPTFIAQTTSLNNDMLLLFFTIMALNAVLRSKITLLSVALSGMLLTNLRGIHIFGAIFLIHSIYFKIGLIKKHKKLFFSYAISGLVFLVFCTFQYSQLGWFIVSQNENFNEHRQVVGFEQVIKNCIVFFKYFMEYGRFIIFVVAIPLLIKYLKKTKEKSDAIIKIFIAFLVFSLVFFVGNIGLSNPFGSRYFMMSYLLSIILLINLLYYTGSIHKNKVLAIIAVFLITGHFWIYPPTLSQAWDSSLSYLNYYKVESKMEKYIDTISLLHSEIGTRVPLNSRIVSELNTYKIKEDYASFNINDNKYILLSNIENETKDDEFLLIAKKWNHIKTFSNLGVFMALYQKP